MISVNMVLSRSRRFFAVGLLLFLVADGSLGAATGTVDLGPPPTPAKRERQPSPPLASLPKPAAGGPLHILLVDDDWSDNNSPAGNGHLSKSDEIYRELVAAAVDGKAAAWSVEVVELHKNGPGVDRLRNFNVVLWYTGGSYGGGHDNTDVLSLEDEKTVRRYLDETGGSFILVSPGYVNNYSYGNTWTDAPVAFLTEVVGINGFSGLVQRFTAGTVTAFNGAGYVVQEKGAAEPQFSGVNPDGAAVLFTASLDPKKTAAGGVPVAVAHPYARGRFVYVGFTFENLLTRDLAPAFGQLLLSAGWPTGAVATAAAPTVKDVAVTQISPRTAPAVSGLQTVTPTTPLTQPPPPRTIGGSDPVVISQLPVDPVKRLAITETVMKDVDFDNWGFEHKLSGWTASGTAFGNQPTFGDNVSTTRVLHQMEYTNNGVGGDYWKDQGYPNGYKGVFWLGTYENRSGEAGSVFGATQGDVPTGEVLSPEFQITQSYCYFLIGGGSDANALKVELQIKQADGSWKMEAARTSFRNSELLYRENFALTALKGKMARIRIVDNATGSWGHINVDDFVFRDTAMDGITLTEPATNRPYLVDEDYPVWGIADTHCHPAHDDGFGGKLVLGKADDPLSVAYSSALCRANHSMLGLGGLNTIFTGGGDLHPFMEGWPDFIGFPRFNSRTHQQQHVEFLKRAWQGGLRLIAALAINNMYLPSLAMGPGSDGAPYDDHEVTLRQIQDLKRIAASQSSWMEIAYTPKDARRIISEGKCAMVLGLELDNFGNLKVPSYNWNDAVGPSNSRLVSLTPANANQLITEKVNQYYNLGIRQVTPIHYLSGTFGGAAVFRGQIALIQFAFNNSIEVKSGIDRKIPFSLADDYSASMLAVAYTPAEYRVRIHATDAMSTINSMGLTDFGQTLVNRLMDKGIILDSEHMGLETKENLFSLAARRDYPVMSSHTDPTGLSFNWLNGPTPFQSTPEERMQNFGTTNIRNLATEFNLTDEHYQKIRSSGGTVGVFMLPYLKKPYQGYLGSIPNDCAGSSKTWAQMYLYSVEKMEGKSVALATDRGMTDFIAPRFGPNAGYTLADEILPSMRKDARGVQRNLQRNGVKYDRPMSSFHISWYHQYDGDTIDEYENDAWIAFAALEANVPTDRTPASYYVVHLARVTNYVKGFRANSEADLEQPFLINGDSPWEQAAMYCLKANKTPSGLAAYPGYNPDQKNRLNTIYGAVATAWETWKGKYGNNAPIRRFKTGNRDWDFNTDGMAHYGLMPDFLQDLRNVGMTPGNLTPLLRSAEDYLRMWEKSIKSSGSSL